MELTPKHASLMATGCRAVTPLAEGAEAIAHGILSRGRRGRIATGGSCRAGRPLVALALARYSPGISTKIMSSTLTSSRESTCGFQPSFRFIRSSTTAPCRSAEPIDCADATAA